MADNTDTTRPGEAEAPLSLFERLARLSVETGLSVRELADREGIDPAVIDAEWARLQERSPIPALVTLVAAVRDQVAREIEAMPTPDRDGAWGQWFAAQRSAARIARGDR